MAPNPGPLIVKVSEKTAERTERFSIKIGDVLVEGYVGKHVRTKYEALLELAKNSNGALHLDEKGENRKYVSGIRVMQNGMAVAKVDEDGRGGLQFYEKGGLGAVVDRNGEVFFLGLDQMKFKGGDLMTGQYDPYTKDIRMLASSVIRNVAGFHNAATVSEEKIRDLSASVFGEYVALTSDFIAANNMILEKNLPKNDQFQNMFSVNTELCRVAFEYAQGARGQEFAEIVKWNSAQGGAIIQNGFGPGFAHEISGEMERKSLPEISYWKKIRRYNRATAKALGIICFPAEEPVLYGAGVLVQSEQKTVACAPKAPGQKENPENDLQRGFRRLKPTVSGQPVAKLLENAWKSMASTKGNGNKEHFPNETKRRRKKMKETGNGDNGHKTNSEKPEQRERMRKTKKKEQELLKKEKEGFGKNVKKKENELLKASESKTRGRKQETAANGQNEQKLGKKSGPKGFLGGNLLERRKPEPLTYGLRVRRSGQAELRARNNEIGDDLQRGLPPSKDSGFRPARCKTFGKCRETFSRGWNGNKGHFPNDLSELDKESKVTILTERNKKNVKPGSPALPAAHSPFAIGRQGNARISGFTGRKKPEKITEHDLQRGSRRLKAIRSANHFVDVSTKSLKNRPRFSNRPKALEALTGFKTVVSSQPVAKLFEKPELLQLC